MNTHELLAVAKLIEINTFATARGRYTITEMKQALKILNTHLRPTGGDYTDEEQAIILGIKKTMELDRKEGGL